MHLFSVFALNSLLGLLFFMELSVLRCGGLVSTIADEFIVVFRERVPTARMTETIDDVFSSLRKEGMRVFYQPSVCVVCNLSSHATVSCRDYDLTGFKHPLISGVYRQHRYSRALLSADSFSGSSYASSSEMADVIEANVLWELGFKGEGVKVGVFDSGISSAAARHVHVDDCTNWTDDGRSFRTCEDDVGHGTFVSGLIGSAACGGIAPMASVYVFKVFSDRQESYTSWMLDALNYAMTLELDIINLSVGGPDYMDVPFVEKIREVAASGVTIVCAVGNDGPSWGTVTHPSSQLEVLSVGGVDMMTFDLAAFSSRGMTLQSCPSGIGHPKPDIVAPASNVLSIATDGEHCTSSRGTSIAAPIVSGSLALLASVHRSKIRSPSYWREVLISGAVPLAGRSLWEQGAGQLNLLESFRLANSRRLPDAYAWPVYFDGLDPIVCDKVWGPVCAMVPVYESALPFLLNFTIANGKSIRSRVQNVRFLEDEKFLMPAGLSYLFTFDYSKQIWPFMGFLSINLTVFRCSSCSVDYNHRPDHEDRHVIGVVSGSVRLFLEDVYTSATSTIDIVIRIPGYFPRDNLEVRTDWMDWHGDHIFTNYRRMFERLRNEGYSLELLGSPWHCVNMSLYGALLLVDTEDEFSLDEKAKLIADVVEEGLGLVVFADWYNSDVLEKLEFFDSSIRMQRFPATGGANLPALNELLSPFGIAFGSGVFHGHASVFHRTDLFSTPARESFYIASATEIVSFPETGLLVPFAGVTSMLPTLLGSQKLAAQTSQAPFLLGFLRGYGPHGNIAVFTDSNCIDESHRDLELQGSCFSLLSSMIRFVAEDDLSTLSVLQAVKADGDMAAVDDLPLIRHPRSEAVALSRSLHFPDGVCNAFSNLYEALQGRVRWKDISIPRGFIYQPTRLQLLLEHTEGFRWIFFVSLIAVTTAIFYLFTKMLFSRKARIRGQTEPTSPTAQL